MSAKFDPYDEDWQPFVTQAGCEDYLKCARERFGVLNLSYWHLEGTPGHWERPHWISTYDRAYMALYQEHFHFQGDSGFNLAFRRPIPLDWNEARAGDDDVSEFHHVAEDFGIGPHGISYPIVDSRGRAAMFSVNFDCTDGEWPELRRNNIGQFGLLAHFFHERARALFAPGVCRPHKPLSVRELETLKWAAAGKTSWETAAILGLSERSVRFYTENAINKLAARSKTQAVAIAIKGAMIN